MVETRPISTYESVLAEDLPKPVYIKATHQYSYRNGQWAQIIGFTWSNNRICYVVQFIDGKRDWWPVYDSSEPYEFAAEFK